MNEHVVSLSSNYNLFYNNILYIPFISFIFATILKWITSKIKEWKINLKRAFGSWGMPSVHSAVVTSLTTAIALKYWVHSDLFAICIGFTVIIIYDAINVRFEAGLHAEAINKLVWENFKEHLWHLPSEAFAGSVLWILTSILLYII